MSGAGPFPKALTPPRGAGAQRLGGAMKHAVKNIHFVGTTTAEQAAFVMSAALAADVDEGARS